MYIKPKHKWVLNRWCWNLFYSSFPLSRLRAGGRKRGAYSENGETCMELGVATYDWQSQPMDPGDGKSHGPTHEKDLALWQYLWTVRKTLAEESTEFTLNVSLHPGRIILHVFSFWRKKVTFFYFFKISRASVMTVCVYVLRRVWFLESPLTATCLAPLSTEFPSKNTRVSCHFPVQGIFPAQGSNPRLPRWRVDSLPLSHLRSWTDMILGFNILE